MPDCAGTVPLVSRRLALQRLGRIPRWQATAILNAAVTWLTEQHPGLERYSAIQGRKHTDEELVATGRELATVALLPCPFKTVLGTCLLEGLGPKYTRPDETGSAPYSWLPMHVAKELAPETTREMVKQGAIADAKAVYLNTNEVSLLALHAR